MSSDALRIGRYEVITRLAIGGMAELFLAREQGIAGLERLVVLKRILPHLADNPSFVDMFLREARIVARLAHPNVVQIFDLGEEDGSFFIAMEYIHGSTVRELQVLSEKHGRSFPLQVTIGIIAQALRGLHAAHELRDLDGKTLGLVHRDISPHNIMCTTDGHVKLLDFGVAKATEEGLEATNSGHLKGKFAYMSPEQARRLELDRRSDVFGMGIVTWEMLTGERLFKRDAEVDMMEAVLHEPVAPPSSLNPEVPAGIDRVVMSALERDRDRRISDAETMRQELSRAAGDAGFDYAPDAVSVYVNTIAGPHLDLRRETLQNALERSLTNMEREGLLHVTGSESTGSADTEIDIPLAVRMTRDAIAQSQERSRSGSGSNSGISSDRRSGSRSSTGSVRKGAPGDSSGAGATGETAVSRHLDATSTRSNRKNRRGRLGTALLVLGLLVGVAVALTYNVLTSDSEPDEAVLLGEPMPIAWSPTVDPEILRAEIDPLRRYLERTTGRPVPIEVTASYGESSEKLLKGQVSFAVLPPLMYVRTHDQNPRVKPIAIKLFDGAAQSDGLILVRGGTTLRTLADLEGKKFCFTDRNSTTGHFLPRAFIRRQGYEPAEFIAEIHWSGDHIQALRDLIAGECDAAATYSGAFISADQFNIPVGQLRQIAITGNVPQDPIVAGPGIDGSNREVMQKALMAFDPQKELGLDRLGETQRITAFGEVDDSDFDFLREVIKEYRDMPELDLGTD